MLDDDDDLDKTNANAMDTIATEIIVADDNGDGGGDTFLFDPFVALVAVLDFDDPFFVPAIFNLYGFVISFNNKPEGFLSA